MGSEVTEEQMKEYFTFFDDDDSGTINVNELSSLIRAVMQIVSGETDVYVPPLLVKVMMAMGDTNANDVLTFEEFQVMFNKYKDGECSVEEGLRILFRTFDEDNSGCLSPEEVRQLLVVQTGLVTDAELQRFMKGLDLDDNGRVNLEEFLVLFKKYGYTN